MNLPRRHKKISAAATPGFTLLEIMIVVAVMGLVIAGLVPTLLVNGRKEPFRKAVAEIVEVCESARRHAILTGSMTEVHFYPQARRVSVGASGDSETSGSSVTSASWSDTVILEMLDVNLTEWKDAEEARVRFHPNGTSDEMTVILRSERNEYKKITLEPMTALASAEPLLR